MEYIRFIVNIRGMVDIKVVDMNQNKGDSVDQILFLITTKIPVKYFLWEELDVF